MTPAGSTPAPLAHPMDAFFRPRSVAVIGATESERSVGRTALWNLISSPFGGTVYPVNPKRPAVLGMRAYPKLNELPEQVDLAVIATPAQTTPAIVSECVQAGVRGAIILAAGFREMGPSGEELERQVLDEARKGSLRILGPNCLGVMSPNTGLNATFAKGMARAGTVAFISQSGALCTAVLDWSHRELVGFSAFVSIGAMADVGWGDLIDYLGNDPRTRSILLYMESIGDANAFLSAAREVALAKPVIVIKAGRTSQGSRAAVAHTGARTGNDEVLDAALRRVGVLRVRRISELFYMAEVLSKQPRPQGNRLTIVTNAGGPAVLATDALIAGGGELAPLPQETMETLSALLPQEWSRNNPIDILGDASPERYAKTLEAAAGNPQSDGLLVILAPQSMTDPTATAERLKLFASSSKPILASWMGGVEVAEGAGLLRTAQIPCFPYPDTAAQMFLYMLAYNENLRAIYETPLMEPAWEELHSPGAGISLEGRNSLSAPEMQRLLDAYGVNLPPASKLVIGCFPDEQFGPVLFVENEIGERSLGLPPLTTTLAGLILERLRLSEIEESMKRLLVRLGRMVVEQPRIRTLSIGGVDPSITLYPASITPDLLPRPAVRPYPAEYVAKALMRNGEEVVIRPIRPEDEPLIIRFHETLSDRTVYFRYLSALKLSTRIAHERLVRICFIDYSRQMALVVERRRPEGAPEIIAVGRLSKDSMAYARGSRLAEFAIVVSDAFQGQGLGKQLLRRLIEVARRERVAALYGEISSENQIMQAICRALGFQITRDPQDTLVKATLELR